MTTMKTINIHASTLRDCRRASFYKVNNEPRTNSQDHSFQQVSRRMAGALNAVVLDTMAEAGWTISHTNLSMSSDSFIPGTHVSDTVHAIGHHPDWTQDRDTVIRVQARTEASIQATQRHSIITAHQELEARLAFLHLQANTEGLTDPEAPAILATLNLDSRQVHIDMLFPHQSEAVNDETKTWLVDNQSNVMPNPDYNPESYECRHCPWLDTCHGPQEDDEDPEVPEDIYESLEKACDDYAVAHNQTREHAKAEKQRSNARDAIKGYLVQQKLSIFTHQGEHTITAKLTPTSPVNVDVDELKRIVSPAQFRQIVTVGKSERINIKVT